MTQDSTLFACSTVEALYVAALLGGRHLVGFPDPFSGWLTEEVEPELNAAREGLAARGVLELHPNGSATLHDPAAALFSGCLSARASLLLTFAAGDAVRQINYHLTDSEIIVHAPDASQIAHRLWLSRDSAGLVDEVMHFFPLGEPAAPEWKGSAVGVVRAGPEWAVEGAAFMAGAGGLWQVWPATRRSESRTEAIPCTPEQAAEELRGVLRQVLAAPGQSTVQEGF